jgi:hypothetical protein
MQVSKTVGIEIELAQKVAEEHLNLSKFVNEALKRHFEEKEAAEEGHVRQVHGDEVQEE